MTARRTGVQLLALGSAIGAVNTAPFSRRATESCYDVEDVGVFNSYFSIDFTAESSLPSPLVASTYTVGAGTAPYARQFNVSNIIATSGQPLQMLVPGGQSASPIESAQMTTSYDDVLYGSIRTVAKASNIAGTVHGFFMYEDDNQETDIEIQTTNLTAVHWTNQQTYSGAPTTTSFSAAPDDITTAFHEYRYDWLPDRCDFYIDGVLQNTFTENIPTSAGYLMWNNVSTPALVSPTSIAYTNKTKIVVERKHLERGSTCLRQHPRDPVNRGILQPH